MSWHDIGDGTAGHDRTDRDGVRLEIRILEALGDPDAAQILRWKTFEATLEGAMLRDYLAHLPDFAEFETLDRAFAHAAAFSHRYTALAFFLDWPRQDLAAKLVLDHLGAWDGRHYGALAPAAEALAEKHPAAATVLYRALIHDILARARSPAYGHAARYLAELAGLASRIDCMPPEVADHPAYLTELRRAHGRKTGFWTHVDQAG